MLSTGRRLSSQNRIHHGVQECFARGTHVVDILKSFQSKLRSQKWSAFELSFHSRISLSAKSSASSNKLLQSTACWHFKFNTSFRISNWFIFKLWNSIPLTDGYLSLEGCLIWEDCVWKRRVEERVFSRSNQLQACNNKSGWDNYRSSNH